MRKFEKKQIEVEDIREVTCNKCGKTVVKNEEDQMSRYFFDATIHNISIKFGYGSEFDGEKWDFDLCDECIEEFVKTFKFLPNGYEIA